MHIRVVSWSLHTGVLAYLDGVRVRIRPRVDLPPKWICDAHPAPEGRTTCRHIAALAAATPPPPAETRPGPLKGNTP